MIRYGLPSSSHSPQPIILSAFFGEEEVAIFSSKEQPQIFLLRVRRTARGLAEGWIYVAGEIWLFWRINPHFLFAMQLTLQYKVNHGVSPCIGSAARSPLWKLY